MSLVYQFIGRMVVALVWARFGRQIRFVAIGAALAAALAVYLLGSRDVEEG